MNATAAPRMGLGLGSRLSFMMFLQYAIWGAWLPLLYPFLLGYRGFSLEETGICFSAGAVGAIFGPFIAGQLADRMIATEKLLGISHLIGAVLIYSLGQIDSFVPFAIMSGVYGFVYAPTIALTGSRRTRHVTALPGLGCSGPGRTECTGGSVGGCGRQRPPAWRCACPPGTGCRTSLPPGRR